MRLKFKNILLSFILLLPILSCSDSLEFSASDGPYISIGGINLRNKIGTNEGDAADLIVNSLRILIFDKTTGVIKDNTYYNAQNKDIISFAIKAGTYDFVFIANEPSLSNVKAVLENITNYSELNNIAFPAESFSSTQNIPMIQAIDNVEVLSDGSGAKINGGATLSIIVLNLNRMAARLDIELKASEDLSLSFKGINLSGMPNVIPLFPLTYTGTISRNVSRSYTLADDGGYFNNTAPPAGYNWGIKVDRIIIPSNDFMPKSDSDKAITFTVNLENKYSPFCKLEIENTPTSNYSLPNNTKLDIVGTVKMPLDLNIVAKPWTSIDEDWGVGSRKLTVSAIKANITDFNGVRISFSTNLPKVRVLPNVVNLSTSAKIETNAVFNDLAATVASPSPSRFYFDQNTGTGYLDILADGGRFDASLNQPGLSSYKLTLLAEDADEKRSIQRDIIINLSQYGTRPGFNLWGEGYTGAFYKKDEVGERIISGQHHLERPWTVRVPEEYRNFIQISSTPSFDPKVGTDDPGNPEQYIVTPNSYRNESGYEVKGRGRIYFRVGMKNRNLTNTPRYGVLEIKYYPDNSPATNWEHTDYYYIRQGEDADYVFGNDETITDGILTGQKRTAARKFSPYNLTSPSFKGGLEPSVSTLFVKGGVFVDYPTQAGAFFVWGTTEDGQARKAYHPIKDILATDWPKSIGSGFWNNNYKPTNDICPTGYSRPSDGFDNKKSFNGKYVFETGSPDAGGDYSGEIANSNFRVSLFAIPEAGNGFSNGAKPTYPGSSPNLNGGTSEALAETKGGLYADGFFDRRPITYNAVSRTNAQIAYGGLLIFNKTTKASLFFPAAGRRHNENRSLEYNGSAGYYWSSSVGPWYKNAEHPVWRMSFAYWNIGPSSELSNFGQSIRCIKD